ncbi:integrase [Mesorhizobium sp. NZP2298]|nr:integrase [Mesorhizobium sp. NZP2298]
MSASEYLDPRSAAATPPRSSHTLATKVLSAGGHPKTAGERLGHPNIGITLDLHSDVMPGMQADAAEQVDVALQAAISSERKGKQLQTA